MGSFGSSFGKKETYDKFRKEIFNLIEKIKDNIVFTGFISNKELPSYHALSDIVFMPSIYSEPAGMVAIEALASGRPVITTDAGGIPEYVNNNCAIIVPRSENFVINLKNEILSLSVDKLRRNQMGLIGIETAKQYSPQTYYNNFYKVLYG